MTVDVCPEDNHSISIAICWSRRASLRVTLYGAARTGLECCGVAKPRGSACGSYMPRGHEPRDEICCNASCILASHVSYTTTDHSAMLLSIQSLTSAARLLQAPYGKRMVWGAIGWRKYGWWQWTRAREAGARGACGACRRLRMTRCVCREACLEY